MANDFKKQAAELMPREKMKSLSSASEMASEDLLAILLKTGAEGCDVMELSRRLISMAGSVGQFVNLASNWRSLRDAVRKHNKANPDRKIMGIGETKMLELTAAIELARRSTRGAAGDDDGAPPKTIRTVEDAIAVFCYAYRGRGEQECFLVLPLDTRNNVLCDPICVTRGTVSSTPVHPREVFKEAIRWGASSILVAHNHPSGNTSPSKEDLELTKRLVEVSQLVSIPLIDHIIVGTSSSGRTGISLRKQKFVDFMVGNQ